MSPTDLEAQLDRLFAFFRESFAQVSWRQILIAEAKMITDLPSYQIPRAALFTPQQYADRFAELLTQGYSWINLQVAGVFEDTMLIVVEWPQYKSGAPRPAVNFSGPYLVRGRESWNLLDRVTITD